MKASLHPKYYENAQVVCSCGNMFTVGSTKEVIHVELCDKCHPFYTGQQKFIDTASRIEKFNYKVKAAKTKQDNKKQKEEKQEYQGPMTLRDMLQAIKR